MEAFGAPRERLMIEWTPSVLQPLAPYLWFGPKAKGPKELGIYQPQPLKINGWKMNFPFVCSPYFQGRDAKLQGCTDTFYDYSIYTINGYQTWVIPTLPQQETIRTFPPVSQRPLIHLAKGH